jgi:hypothetical protein
MHRKRAVWVLSGLTLLSCLFAVQTYYEVLLFTETWRVRNNVFIQLKMAMRLFAVIGLTIGAGIGPFFVVYRLLSRRFRSLVKRRTMKKSPNSERSSSP